MTIHILTRCTRLEKLKDVEKSIFLRPTSVSFNWHIIFDTSSVREISTEILRDFSRHSLHFWESTPGDMAHQLLNRVIDSLQDHEWIYVLDDDNQLHTDFFQEIENANVQYPEAEGFIFSQKVGGRDFTGLEVREAKPENVEVRKIDMAQFLLQKSLIGSKRFAPRNYVADGIFISELHQENPEKIVFLEKVLCNYNSLQTGKEKNWSLPRILVMDESPDLKSLKRNSYESDDLNVKPSSDSESHKQIAEFDPDCILTSGETYEKYSSLMRLPYDFRQRWIHTDLKSPFAGESAYVCSMNYILNSDKSDLVSIFTPAYNTGKKIYRTYQSVCAQTHSNWEWVVLDDSTENETSRILRELSSIDPRVKLYTLRERSNGVIGEAKYRACVLSKGDFLMELDHDDYLLPHSLQRMIESFRKFPDAGFAYSDCAEIDEGWNSLTYGENFSFGYGSYREESHIGRTFKVAACAGINPLTVRHIVGVPNHFRAWRRETYFRVGGHNRRLSIADDYDLLVRTFLKTRMIHVPECCYLQFHHGENSQDSSRADIQRRVRTIALFYNDKIRARFEELGKEDWAFRENSLSWDISPVKGEKENNVNYTL
jgi:glycosyltransferase involved in cell wall biosynthesis